MSNLRQDLITALKTLDITQSTLNTVLNSLLTQLDVKTSQTPQNRASQKTGRTYVTFSGTNTGADNTLYTVTGGKTFYLIWCNLFGLTNQAVVAYNSIRDGGAAGTIKAMSNIIVGTVAGVTTSGPSVAPIVEPIQFTTDVYFKAEGSTMQRKTWVAVGYEE